jgi:hypothetical protein
VKRLEEFSRLSNERKSEIETRMKTYEETIKHYEGFLNQIQRGEYLFEDKDF